MKTIKLIKVAESPDAKFKSADWDNYIPGQDNPDVSLPIEYWIKGALIKEPVVGESLFISRTERNGVEAFGYFTSSPIVEISSSEHGGFVYIETANSVYLVEPLD